MRRIILFVVTKESAFPTIKMTLYSASAMMASQEHLAVRKNISYTGIQLLDKETIFFISCFNRTHQEPL